jgi:hypothetical protein
VKPAALVLGLAAALAACAGWATPPDTVTDAQIKAYAARSFDKSQKMFKQDVLGIHHGAKVVADFPCSDVCPQYTTRVIHYDVEPGPACEAIGGVTQARRIPMGIGSGERDYCVPKVLAEEKQGS